MSRAKALASTAAAYHDKELGTYLEEGGWVERRERERESYVNCVKYRNVDKPVVIWQPT